MATQAPALSPRAERARRRLLEAAARRFGHHGFAKTTVEEVAAAAGVSKGLVYAYFESKEALYAAVVQDIVRDWEAVLAREVEAKAGDSAAEALCVMHRASLEFARTRPLLPALLSQDQRMWLAGFSDVVGRAVADWRGRVEALLAEGVASGELRADLDVPRTADVVCELFMAFVDRVFADGGLRPGDGPLVEATLSLVLRGVVAPAAELPRRARGRRRS